jgi:hypothetical protein
MQNTCYVHTFGTYLLHVSLLVHHHQGEQPCNYLKNQFLLSHYYLWVQFCSLYAMKIHILQKAKHASHIFPSVYKIQGPGSSVGIATVLRAGRSGIEFRWERDFTPVQTEPGAHPASCKMGTGSFTGVKCGRGVLLTTHPFLVPRSWKSRAISLPILWATPGL